MVRSPGTGPPSAGRLEYGGPAPAEPTKVTATRTDAYGTRRPGHTGRLGTGTLSSVRVAADGTFTVDGIPRTRRETTYRVSWQGDDLYAGATASATVYMTR